MLILELEEGERKLLMGVIAQRLRDLHEEVQCADSADLNNALWNEENALKRLCDRLRPIPVAFDALAGVI